MIDYTLKIGQEEKEALMSISMKSEAAAKQRKTFKTCGLIVGIVFALVMLFSGSSALGPGAVVAIAFALWGVQPYQNWSIKRNFNKLEKKQGQIADQHYKIDENGIDLGLDQSNSVIRWGMIAMWDRESHFIWLQRLDNQVILLDENKLTAEEKNELLGYLESVKTYTQIQKEQEEEKKNKKKNKKKKKDK